MTEVTQHAHTWQVSSPASCKFMEPTVAQCHLSVYGSIVGCQPRARGFRSKVPAWQGARQVSQPVWGPQG